jgi:hypothetical protein
VSNHLPDDIVVTQTSIDEGHEAPKGSMQVEADAEVSYDGSVKTIVIKLDTATLTLSYDTDSEESATHAAVLMASAPTILPEIDLESDNG